MTTDTGKMVLLLAGVIPVVLGLQASAIWVAGSLIHREVPAGLAESETVNHSTDSQPPMTVVAPLQPKVSATVSTRTRVLETNELTSIESEPVILAEMALKEESVGMDTTLDPLDAEPGPPTDSAVVAEASQQMMESEKIAEDAEPEIEEEAEFTAELAGPQDTAWLSQRDPARFTLQVNTATSPDRLLEFARDNNLPQPQAYYRTVWGKSSRYVYALVAGDYPDSQTALAAARELTAHHPQVKPWMRSFNEVQSQIR